MQAPGVGALCLLLSCVSLPAALGAPGGLRLTVFNTTTFAQGDLPGSSPVVSFTPGPIALSGLSFLSDYQSARFEGTLAAPASGNWTITVASEGAVRVWISDHLVTNDVWEEGLYLRNCTTLYPAVLVGGRATPIRVEVQHNLNTPLLALYWSVPGEAVRLIPASALASDVRPCEDARWSLRDRLGVASPVPWGTHWIDNMAMHVHLPSRFGVPFTLLEPASGASLDGGVRVFGRDNPARVQMGPHSVNGSDYTMLNVSAWGTRDCAVSFETAVEGDDLLVLITSTGSDCASLVILSQPVYLWNAGGWLYNVVDGRIDAWRPGFVNVSYFSAQALAPHVPLSGPFSFSVSLSAPAIAFSVSQTGYNYSLVEVESAVIAARAAYAAGWAPSDPELAEVFGAVQTIVAWNTVFSAVLGTFTPVSRGWNWGPEQSLVFDWDTVRSPRCPRLRPRARSPPTPPRAVLCGAAGVDSGRPATPAGHRLRKSSHRHAHPHLACRRVGGVCPQFH
jgi:hypothetical protein